MRISDWSSDVCSSDLGIAPQRGFARNYPTGAAVGHLIGYVGAPNAEEYQKAKDPLYITPGYKIGKDGLEKYFQEMLKGEPGARRSEEHTSELQSLMRISYAVFCLKKKKHKQKDKTAVA